MHLIIFLSVFGWIWNFQIHFNRSQCDCCIKRAILEAILSHPLLVEIAAASFADALVANNCISIFSIILHFAICYSLVRSKKCQVKLGFFYWSNYVKFSAARMEQKKKKKYKYFNYIENYFVKCYATAFVQIDVSQA